MVFEVLFQALSAIDAFFDGLPLLSADVNEDALDYWLSVQGNTVNVNAADTMVLPNQLLFEVRNQTSRVTFHF